MSIFEARSAMTTDSRTVPNTTVLQVLLAAGALSFVQATSAAVTQLADAPLANGVAGSGTVRPNIAFIVDDSSSMNWQTMPDSGDTNRDKKCWGWHGYNTVFYNPAVTYKPPFKLDGAAYSDGVTRFPDAVFTAALNDGYFPAGGYTFGGGATSNSTTDLSNTSNLTTTASSPYYYATQTTTASTTCEADANYSTVTAAGQIAAPGVNAGSAAAKTNYANWYSYYRRRATLMKAGAGEAFKDLPEDKYRVGLFFINSIETGAGSKNNDLQIDAFSGSAAGTHRKNWYDKLYVNRADSGTPLRGALSRTGRLFAGKVAGWDPVQYSCQQNFAILSTDGSWNSGDETATYGPFALDGTTVVGNTDGAVGAGTSAKATIVFGSFSGTKYRASSLTVSGLELLNLSQTPLPSNNGTDVTDTFGGAIATSVNQQTGSTGYTATYDGGGNTLTLTAPYSAGNLTATPVLTRAKVGNGTDRAVTISAFSGYATPVNGGTAPRPFADALNISDTLADVGYYYYQNDLRTAALGNCTNTITNTGGSTTYSNLCENNVLGSGKDSNQQQHMTTFTLGLGVSGTIQYESNYESAGDIAGVSQYFDINNGTVNWPNPTNQDAKIDDLWHAAVNGRGTYYAANNAETLSAGIRGALAGVAAQVGSSSAAATSNLEPVAGDNFVYVALYRTVKWDGDLLSYTIDPNSGVISTTALWSAQTNLDATVAAAQAASAGTDGRTIKYFNSAATNKLKDFTNANLTTDGKIANFSNFCTKSPIPDQCGTDSGDLNATQKGLANASANLIKYLRGSAVNEEETGVDTANRLYRDREHVLGDIVNAVPVYVKKPGFTYDTFDTTYAGFKTANIARLGTTYVAANDGMLHAIDATAGTERWAYVPSFVMGNMWKLADRSYGDNHTYLTDGSPTVADICTGLKNGAGNEQLCNSAGDWKTILVAGLNKGGCGYYALDVTDPANPKGLWEFSNANLGYSFGNPVVAKRADGTWVVIFTSGYNNYPSNGCGTTGDGNGHVFVVNAATGALLEDIVTYTTGTTPAGTTATPNGLAKLNAYIDNAALPIVDRLYGGDLLGNVWRFDIDSKYLPAGKEAVLLAALKDGSGNAQPITTKPELGEVKAGGSNYNVVFVGTGKYLGNDDRADTSQQSIYALKDQLTASGITTLRGTGSTMVPRTLTQTSASSNGALAGRTIRTISGSTMDWTSADGWYFDFNPGGTSPGERVNVDMQLQYNVLTLAGNVPESNMCSVGGSAYLYYVDINTGKALSTATDSYIGIRLSGNALVAGIKTVKLTSGKTVTIVTTTSGRIEKEDNPSATSGGVSGVSRTTWREIPD
jgi:type IV pilus assembly protein PilY1